MVQLSNSEHAARITQISRAQGTAWVLSQPKDPKEGPWDMFLPWLLFVFSFFYFLGLSPSYSIPMLSTSNLCQSHFFHFIFPHSIHKIFSSILYPFWKGQTEKQAAVYLFKLISNSLYSAPLIKWKLCASTGPIFELYIFSGFVPHRRGKRTCSPLQIKWNVMTQQLRNAGNLYDSRWRIKDH